jgi:hypothetical protein
LGTASFPLSQFLDSFLPTHKDKKILAILFGSITHFQHNTFHTSLFSFSSNFLQNIASKLEKQEHEKKLKHPKWFST